MTTTKPSARREGRIDWDEVKKRLKASEQALENVSRVDDERLQIVFRQRAEQLATRQLVVSSTRRLLVFTLSSERHGIDLDEVLQVFPFTRCTPVAGSPWPVLGVSNLLGEIRSILDLSRILELPDADTSAAGYILLVRGRCREPTGTASPARLGGSTEKRGAAVGFRVDYVEKIQPIESELTALGEETCSLPVRYLKGFTPDRILVLNTEAVFEHPVFKDASE